MTKTKARRPATLIEFADTVGIHHSMASRLRSGHRSPSLMLLAKIADTYGLDMAKAAKAAAAGEFGPYLDRYVFGLKEAAAA